MRQVASGYQSELLGWCEMKPETLISIIEVKRFLLLTHC